MKYGKGQRGIPGWHLYAHFFSAGYEVIKGMTVKVIDKSGVWEPTRGEAFCAYKLDSFILKGLQQKNKNKKLSEFV